MVQDFKGDAYRPLQGRLKDIWGLFALSRRDHKNDPQRENSQENHQKWFEEFFHGTLLCSIKTSLSELQMVHQGIAIVDSPFLLFVFRTPFKLEKPISYFSYLAFEANCRRLRCVAISIQSWLSPVNSFRRRFFRCRLAEKNPGDSNCNLCRV